VEGARTQTPAITTMIPKTFQFISRPLPHVQTYCELKDVLAWSRYAEAVRATKLAINSDRAYLSNQTVPYGPGHNLAAGIVAASMSGMSAAARAFGEQLRATFAEAPDRPDGPGGSRSWNLPITSPLRLGLWHEVLKDADAGAAPPFPREWPYAEVSEQKGFDR
jgi:hypothetical protein